MKLLRRIYSRWKSLRYSGKMRYGKDCFFGRHFRITGKPGNIFIKNNCYLDCSLYAFGSGTIEIGSHTSIRYNTRIGAIQRIIIGNNVIISNHVTIMDNNNHPTHPEDRMKMVASGYGTPLWSWNHSRSAEIIINDNVWIGERSRICKGVVIGAGAVIAADAVVTKDVPDNSMVAGNPAIVVREQIHLDKPML